jgi:outer membrane receptor protein involved in Fe transport
MYRPFFVVLYVSLSLNIFGQQSMLKNGYGIIKGRIIDSDTDEPVEYANISIYRMADSNLVTGTITNASGNFIIEDVPFGKYQLQADFLGYSKKIINHIIVNANKLKADLDEIRLNKASLALGEVEVRADQARVQYKIDKKVVNVSQDLQSVTGTAADVLGNTPSVNVDIEGNVTLRGSGNFTVLINGRPGALDGSDALQQIPANNIKNIEIITNPSAKYDPDGTAGIINVITKKKRRSGLNGNLNLGIGYRDKYNAEILLNYKTGDFNFTGGFNYRYHHYQGDHTRERETFGEDTTLFTKSKGSRYMYRGATSGNFGVDWAFSGKTNIGLNGKIGVYKFGFGRNVDNQEWSAPGDKRNYYVVENKVPFKSDFYDVNLDFQHHFERKGHKINALAHYSRRFGGNEDISREWQSDDNWNKIDTTLYKTKASEQGADMEARVQIDYTLPMAKEGKFEAGYQTRFEEDIEAYEFDAFIYGTGWLNNDQYNTDMDFSKTIHSVYAMINNKFLGFGYQIGLRTEYTDRVLYDEAADNTYTLDRFDYYPTIHLSKQLPNNHQLQASYSRRVNRPRGYYLEPFRSYMDKENVRLGNPDLKPEYTDSYELNWQKKWGVSFFTIESYYRVTHDMITRRHTLLEENILLHTYDNVNNSYSLGGEVMLNYEVNKKLDINTSGNIYHYRIKGDLEATTVDNESINWDARANTTLNYIPMTKIQLQMRYRGPSVTPEGTRKGYFVSNIAARYDFLDRKANITLQVRDLLGTRKRERTIDSDVYQQHGYLKFESPIVILSFTYRLKNNGRERKEQKGNNGGGGMEMEF